VFFDIARDLDCPMSVGVGFDGKEDFSVTCAFSHDGEIRSDGTQINNGVRR
jgi:hypothetical protein